MIIEYIQVLLIKYIMLTFLKQL